MLIYSRKLRFLACFCGAAIGIASPSLATLSHNL